MEDPGLYSEDWLEMFACQHPLWAALARFYRQMRQRTPELLPGSPDAIYRACAVTAARDPQPCDVENCPLDRGLPCTPVQASQWRVYVSSKLRATQPSR